MITLTTTDLNELDVATVQNLQDQLAQLLREKYPQIDLTRGVVHDVDLMLGATISTVSLSEIQTVEDSMSLISIEANPALADPAITDAVLSNFGLTRLSGAPASGQVTVLIDTSIPVVIPIGPVFTINGAVFQTSQAYAVRENASQVTSISDLVLTALPNNQYAFSVPVTAVDVGLLGMVKRGAIAVPTFAIPHYVASYAESDFIGGVDPENNAALVARMQAGIAAKTIGGRANIDALIHEQSAFAAMLQVSVIGAGDEEMIRDQHTIFPISIFGRADIYVRTAGLPALLAIGKQAVLVAKVPGGSTWQFPIAADEMPGFYEVSNVNLPDDPPNYAGFDITSDVRGFDLSAIDPSWAPDIVNVIEAVYTPYQTAIIQFFDTRTDVTALPLGTTAPYTVSISVLPQLADLQSFMARDIRSPGGDVLIKAPIPCFLSVSFEVRRSAVMTPPNIPAIQNAVSSTVNALGFCGRLNASTIINAVANLIPQGAALGPIDMFGRVRLPDGEEVFLRDMFFTMIEAPDRPDVMTSGRTMCYFLPPASVAVADRIVDVPLI
jgi:hypothetical protein